MSRDNLRRLLAPRSIAFVGGRALAEPIVNCTALGFDGELWVVNPRYDEIAGHACYPSVADLPAAPDAAFVGVGRDLTVDVVRALAARGAGGCVCLASGFAETGGDGAARQAELVVAAGDMAVIGPNCYGILNYVDGVALWPDLHGGGRVSAGAALVAQSGNLALNATMADRSLPLTHVLSIGNQAVTGSGVCVEVLADDPRVRAIGLYVEGVGDDAGLRAGVRRARASGIPVVALHGGASPLGARVVASHTGSDAGHDRAVAEVLHDLGVGIVDSLSALLESLKLCTVWGEGTGPRLGVVAASGGDVALFSDLAATTAIELPPLDWSRASDLREQLGDLVTVANPLDYGTAVWGRHDELVHCFATVMRDDLDAVALVIDYPRPGAGDATAWDTTVDAFVAAHQRTGRRAAVVSTLPEGLPAPVRERLLAGGVVPLQGLREAVAAIAVAVEHGRCRHALAAEAAGDGDARP